MTLLFNWMVIAAKNPKRIEEASSVKMGSNRKKTIKTHIKDLYLLCKATVLCVMHA